MLRNIETYRVREKREEAPGIITLAVTDMNGNVPEFQPGQYITVFFNDSSVSEGKAYSISSAPHDTLCEITVRAIGEFSHKLSKLEIGDTFAGSLPYGFFGPESNETDLVMLASGIGITPFRSIIRATQRHAPLRSMHLFHSVRTHEDAIFREELKEIAESTPFLHSHFVTQEEGEPFNMYSGRINAKRIFEMLPEDRSFEFLVCGSISFTRDMWRDLKKHGVPEDYIYTEAFFTNQ
jgi:ferredoxin-NADP reductase